tara:strand:+ start:6086 stop:6565 length:480 start_codon:yes stop_codon:yes gene_type:complete
MKIIKKFLNDKQFDILQNSILSTKFPWYYNDTKSLPGDNSYQFVHIFYWNDKILSPFWNDIAPILDQLKAKKIIRIKANLTSKKEKNFRSAMHIDTKIEKSKTAVFYCNSNNGSTIFKDGTIINSEENKIVIFDSKKLHCGSDCTDSNIRIVINFNYLD